VAVPLERGAGLGDEEVVVGFELGVSVVVDIAS
jgi:hypothetical protein